MNIVSSLIKWFAGLIIVLAVVVLWIEIMNVRRNSLELADIAYKSMEEACNYFSQETYKGLDDNNTKGLAYGIIADDGELIVSGNFYESYGTTEREIYNNLFKATERDNDHLDYIIDQLRLKCEEDYSGYNIINTLDGVIHGEYTENTSPMPTPANLGITYLNTEILQKIFTWTLANKLSASSVYSDNYKRRHNIIKDIDRTDEGDALGDYYVKWNGFRIYLKGEDVKPYVYIKEEDINVVNIYENDEVADDTYRNIFEKLTGIAVHPWEDYEGNKHPGYGWAYNKFGTAEPLWADSDVRAYKVIYRPRWSLRVAYEGILPIYFVRKLFNTNSDQDYNILDGMNLFDSASDEVALQISKNPADEYNAQSIYQDIKQPKESAGKSNEVVFDFGRTKEDAGILTEDDIEEGDFVSGFASNKKLGIGQSLYYCVVH